MQLFKGMDVVSCLEEVINPRRRVEVVHIKCSLSQPPYLEHVVTGRFQYVLYLGL